MSAGWPIVRLGDYIESSLGKMLDKKKNRGIERRYLGNSNVRWGYFDLINLSEMKFESNESDRYGIKNGDLIVCEGGEPGRCAIWKEAEADMKIQKALHRVRPKPSLNNYYLYYWFLYSGGRGTLEPYFTGTTIKHLTGKALKNLEIQLPPLKYQEYVVKILKGLDSKIELNNQANQTLKHIAQAIFKSWFVDFEPTRAKARVRASIAQGRPRNLTKEDEDELVERAAMAAISGKTLDQLSSEKQQQLKATAVLFPDVLVDSELGEIPKGWKISDLKSATIELRRGISPKYTERNGVQVINQKCIRNHTVNFDLTRLNDPAKRKVDSRLVEIGDVLVNSTGVGTLGRLAPIRYIPKPTVFDSHVTLVRADTTIISKSFLAGLMFSKEAFIESSGAGSTGQTELRKQVLEEIIFVKPELVLSSLFDEIIESVNNQISVFEQQQKTLVFTRDALLPKLLSGELKSEQPSELEVTDAD